MIIWMYSESRNSLVKACRRYFENKKTILYLIALKFANEEERRELNFWYSKKPIILTKFTV
jgi:hypothetical protein